MPEPMRITIPLINPNENEAVIVDLHIANGMRVQRGSVLATLETTKATADVIAEADGYIIGLRVKVGETVHTGDTLCWLADSPDAPVPQEAPASKKDVPASDRRISKPAMERAAELGVDVSRFPPDTFITVEMIEQAAAVAFDLTSLDIKPDDLIIYGGGGHARALIDLIRAEGKWRIVGVADDRLPPGTDLLGVPVLGSGVLLAALHRQGLQHAINAVGGIGDLQPRLHVNAALQAAGLTIPTVIHPRALVEPSAHVEPGCQVFPLAYIGSAVHVNAYAILNTGCIISHDCTIGDFANISPGAILAGAVTIGPRTLIGMGATINLGVTIGAGCRIGNGATVKSDVPDGTVVRAGAVYPARSETITE